MSNTEGQALLAATSIVLLAAYIAITILVIKAQRAQIENQQDTIQRLINREPVTYQEVGKKPEKAIEEVYSAWGNVTVDREVENQ